MNAANDNDPEADAPPEGRFFIVVVFRRFRAKISRFGHRAHRAENWAHLGYFAMLVTSLEYKIAAAFALFFGVIAMFAGEEEF